MTSLIVAVLSQQVNTSEKPPARRFFQCLKTEDPIKKEAIAKWGYRTKRVGKNLYYACIKGRIRGILKYARVAL